MTIDREPQAAEFADKIAGDLEHFSQFMAAEIDPDEGGADDVTRVDDAPQDDLDAVAAEPVDLIGRDTFWDMFQMGFNLSGQMVPDLAPLAITPAEQAPARAASDATHRLLEIYYPAVLKPGGETIMLLLTAGPFFYMKAKVVQAVMLHKREVRRAELARRQAEYYGNQPANDNAPPVDDTAEVA